LIYLVFLIHFPLYRKLWKRWQHATNKHCWSNIHTLPRLPFKPGQLTHWSLPTRVLCRRFTWSYLGFVAEWIGTWRSVASSAASGQQRKNWRRDLNLFHMYCIVPNADLVRTFRLATRKELRYRESERYNIPLHKVYIESTGEWV